MQLTLVDLFDLTHGQSGRGQEGEAVEADSHKQSASRTANDRTYDLLWAFAAEGGAFLCECTRSSCTERVPMTPSEYVRLRDRDEPIYASGHELA
jgi:hypothetical protein